MPYDHHNFGGVDIDQPAPLDDEHLPGFVDDLNAILDHYYRACVYDDDRWRDDDDFAAVVHDYLHDGDINHIFDYYAGRDDSPTAGDNQPL